MTIIYIVFLDVSSLSLARLKIAEFRKAIAFVEKLICKAVEAQIDRVTEAGVRNPLQEEDDPVPIVCGRRREPAPPKQETADLRRMAVELPC